MQGVTIRLFLIDGTSHGPRVVERSNWTGRGYDFARPDWPTVRVREDFERPGVYVLRGKDDDGWPQICIGEADVPILQRAHGLEGCDWEASEGHSGRVRSPDGLNLGLAPLPDVAVVAAESGPIMGAAGSHLPRYFVEPSAEVALDNRRDLARVDAATLVITGRNEGPDAPSPLLDRQDLLGAIQSSFSFQRRWYSGTCSMPRCSRRSDDRSRPRW